MPREGYSLALAQRTSPITDTLSAQGEPGAAGAAPAPVEGELAKGVVAGMFLRKFIEDHMIETTSTLLTVATGTPSEDRGTALVSGDDADRFGLCFTEAMRRALSETQK